MRHCIEWKLTFTYVWPLPRYTRYPTGNAVKYLMHRMCWEKIKKNLVIFYTVRSHGRVGDAGKVAGVIKWALPIRDALLNQAANTSRSLNSKSWHGTITTSMPPSHWSELQYSQPAGRAVSSGHRRPHSSCNSKFPGWVSTPRVHEEDMQTNGSE